MKKMAWNEIDNSWLFGQDNGQALANQRTLLSYISGPLSIFLVSDISLYSNVEKLDQLRDLGYLAFDWGLAFLIFGFINFYTIKSKLKKALSQYVSMTSRNRFNTLEHLFGQWFLFFTDVFPWMQLSIGVIGAFFSGQVFFGRQWRIIPASPIQLL